MEETPVGYQYRPSAWQMVNQTRKTLTLSSIDDDIQSQKGANCGPKNVCAPWYVIKTPLSSKKIFEAYGMRWGQKIHSCLKTHRLNATASSKQGYQWLHKRPPYIYTKSFLPSNDLKSFKSKFANTQFWVQLEHLNYGLEKQSIWKSIMDIKPSLAYLPCKNYYYNCNLLH